MKSAACLLITLISLTFASRGLAAEPPESPEEARQHFRRGIELYEERDFNGAAAEFRRAYQLGPNFRILYNLAQSAQELHDWVSALDLFTRYLKDGVGQLPEERRAEVQQEVSKLRKRVGKLVVVAHGPTAEVLVDGVAVARTPVDGSIDVNLGRRRIELRTADGLSQPQWVDIAGGETTVVELDAPQAKSAVDEDELVESPAAPAPLTDPRLSSGSSSWWAWLATGLCAAGAATTGALTYRYSRDLNDQRNSYPTTQSDLRDQQHKVERMGWVTDGLLAGTAILAGVSLYLTFRSPKADSSLSLGPNGFSWRRVF